MSIFETMPGLRAGLREPEPALKLPKRTVYALSGALVAVVAALATFGPSLQSVLADENQLSLYANILSRETRPNPYRTVERPVRQAAAPAYAAPGRLMQSLFGFVDERAARRAAGPALAYAPSNDAARPVSAAAAHPRPRKAVVAKAAYTPVGASLDSGGGLSRRSVCVRLCDGYAFPVADYNGESDNASHSAICAGMCPAAPTRLYVAAAGSDKLEEAVSVADHKPYSALPVAFRYVDSHDDTCTCHPVGDTVLKSVSVLKDFTLRSGDRVMTSDGFRVFKGAASWPYSAKNFTTLAHAGMARRELWALTAMERASRRGEGPIAALAPGAAKASKASLVRVGDAPAWSPARSDRAKGYDAGVRLVGPRMVLNTTASIADAAP